MNEDPSRSLFFEAHPEPMWIHDLETLRFLEVNDAAVDRYGYSREEFLAMTLADLRSPEHVRALEQDAPVTAGTLDEAGIERHRLKSGEIVYVEITSHAMEHRGRRAELVLARDATRLMALDESAKGRILTGVVDDITERKRSEIAVGESEEQLRIAGRVARLGAWRVVLDPFEVIWSDETAAIHGMPPGARPSFDEAIDYYAPEYRHRIRQHFEACARDGVPFDDVLELIRADGERIWVRVIGEPEHGPEGRVVSVRGAFQDVSDLVAARQAARDLDLRLLNTLESISDGFFTLDPAWNFVFLNSQAERLLARSRDELLGRSVWTVFPEAAGSAFEREYRRAVTEGETVQFAEYHAPLGSWFDVTAYPTENGLAVYLRNVTEQREAEEAVRLSEERFRILAKATNDVIWDWNFVAGTVWWNENFSRMFGYDREELEPGPESWSNRIHPEDRDAVLDSIHAVIDGGGTAWEREYRFLHASGSAVTVIDRGYVIRDANGAAIRMVGSMIDVTERRALDERLRESQKLEAVGQLTGGVAHDFNNLLTVILGNAELLAEELGDRPQPRALAQMVVEAAGRGAELTSRLLAFARRQALEPKVVDINRLVAGMEGLLRRTLPEEVEVDYVGADALWKVDVDPGQLETALLNLAINARDAMPSGGRLTIQTANATLDDDYASRHEGVEPGQYVVISVSDTGSGMPSDVVARAFDPFFTTKPAGEGSGLGLSMVYGFVKQSGGHAKIDAEPGEGTSVKLYFPRAWEGGASPEPAAAQQAVAGGREHVLVVEDEQLVRDHVTRQLRGLGYAVSTAGSGPEALELLERRDGVDLLFTDVVMPGGMNGRQLADAARARQPGLRVLFTSGYPENAILHKGRVDRGIDLLGKPYRREELAAKLRKVLDAPSEA